MPPPAPDQVVKTIPIARIAYDGEQAAAAISSVCRPVQSDREAAGCGAGVPPAVLASGTPAPQIKTPIMFGGRKPAA